MHAGTAAATAVRSPTRSVERASVSSVPSSALENTHPREVEEALALRHLAVPEEPAQPHITQHRERVEHIVRRQEARPRPRHLSLSRSLALSLSSPTPSPLLVSKTQQVNFDSAKTQRVNFDNDKTQ
ncbi:hypothetical protein PybrP1_010990 [[Pythium] brassicae (nom. inval.)]|nr:hypothetical protein PybrP1_010990 [[Pythium] brassicae (nom. inval.)]